MLTLIDYCEPIFQYVCSINRAARRTPQPTLDQVRYELKAKFDRQAAQAKADDYRLGDQFERVRLPLFYFADEIIANSGLPFADKWRISSLAKDEGLVGGGDHFFALLEETLDEMGNDAGERLGVFLVCLGLGFTGSYINRPEELQKLIYRVAIRVPPEFMDGELKSQIVPDREHCVNTDNLTEPPTKSILTMVLLLLALSATVFVLNVAVLKRTIGELKSSIVYVKAMFEQTKADLE